MLIKVKFISRETIRAYKTDNDGKPVGAGVTIRTALDFSIRDENLVRIAILANWRVVKWLRGERLK